MKKRQSAARKTISSAEPDPSIHGNKRGKSKAEKSKAISNGTPHKFTSFSNSNLRLFLHLYENSGKAQLNPDDQAANESSNAGKVQECVSLQFMILAEMTQIQLHKFLIDAAADKHRSAMKKRQSASRKTVSCTRDEYVDNAIGANSMQGNTNKNMHPKNSLYSLLCVYCNKKYSNLVQ